MKSLFVKILFVLSLSVIPLFASADTGNLTGYAWSDNIGWISFTCINTNTCASNGGIDYGVTENPSGNLTGYAWSDNIGWIKFGGLSSFPSGAGTVAQDAQLVGSNVVGWARACAGTVGGDCSSMTSRTDGWDGWISLGGTNYGVSKSGQYYTDYAWGGDVIGWILFDIQNKFPALCPSCGVGSGSSNADLDVRSGGVSGPSIVGIGAVPFGTIPTFVWTIVSPTMSCDITKTVGGTPFTSILGETTSGSRAGNALTSSGLHTYRLACTNPVFTKDVSFTVVPQVGGFSLGGPEVARIQFLGAGPADSEQKTIQVFPSGAFSDPVTVSITGFPAPIGGAVFTYRLGNSPFSNNPPPVVISSPYNIGEIFQVRSSKPITNSYIITLTGTGGGVTVTKEIKLDPKAFDPSFNEI